MLNFYSKINKQILKNLALEGMEISDKQQMLILETINSNKEITTELIRKIALR